MKRLRRILLLLAVTMLLGAVGWVALNYQTVPRLVTGPMVQMLDTDGFTLVWQVHPPRPMRLRLSDGQGAEVADVEAAIDGERQVASVSGLHAGTQYYYDIVEPGRQRVIAGNRVRTAPLAGGAFRLLALGDTGDGGRAQFHIARQLVSWEPDLVIHTGDVIYSHGLREHYPQRFFVPYAELIAQVPMYPCLGNHDVRTEQGAPLLETFILPQNGPPDEPPERNYWFDFGAARIVAIDSNLHYPRLRDVVAPWLDEVLGGAGDRWKIVFFHEPIYTHGKYQVAEKLRLAVAPILDRHRVELVLSGHNHMYERTHPIEGSRLAPDGDGTVYITTGAGGARLYKLRPNPPDYLAAWHDAGHSFTLVDVTSDVAAVRQIDAAGQIIDEHHLLRRPAASDLQVASGR